MALHAKAAVRRPLATLGIGDAEETTYECLLAHPGATAQALAGALGRSLPQTLRLLAAIETKGLATHSPVRPRRYFPAAPEIAMEALLLRRQEDLEGARARVQELKESAKTHRREERELMVELIVTREAQRQAFDHLRLGARHEIVCLTRPPMLITPLSAAEIEHASPQEQRVLARRCIIDQDYLELPGAVETVRRDVENGETTRIFPRLPLKFVLADQRIALIPLDPELPDTPSLLVRSSALLDALYALFELLWQHAAPVTFTRRGELSPHSRDAAVDEAGENLLALLAAGLNDKTIAHKLDISLRTLKRRISMLMRTQKVRTRFQLAWALAPRVDNGRRIGVDRKRGVPR
jgi:sugar-specific transcriptional regulator TrmB/DNA-binding CsgD family transcriptional regulator